MMLMTNGKAASTVFLPRECFGVIRAGSWQSFVMDLLPTQGGVSLIFTLAPGSGILWRYAGDFPLYSVG
jgi:hypothetical protein